MSLHTSNLKSLPLLARGKVRDNYAVGNDRILMVASDRISAFDVIMGEPIPGKGELLTRMALYWFDRLGPKGLNICPIHLTGDAPESVVTAEEVAQVRGRSMLVKRLKPIPVEAVVRARHPAVNWVAVSDDAQALRGVASGRFRAAVMDADFLKDKENYLDLKMFYQQKRDLFLSLTKTSRFIPYKTSGTYFQLMSYKNISEETDTEIAVRLTREKKLASIPLSVFYHNNCCIIMLIYLLCLMTA